ncbi:MAG TPA: GNAT family N-acetyltransferase [Actinomycetes bacterium]|nr:GNAT family N-acetyltransferase [Actinomycetes bacterium]
MTVIVRDALPAEYDQIGAITFAAYRSDGLISDDSQYVDELTDAARRAAEAELIAAVDADTGAILGTVTFCLPGSVFAERAEPGEAEFRMLAVAPGARGRGAGEALVRECMRRAGERGCTRLVLLTRPQMRAARTIYTRLGFRRIPERDWWPRPDLPLRAYVLDL